MNEVREHFSQKSSDELLLTGGGIDEKTVALKVGAAACALLLTGSLVGGYFFLRGRNVQNLQAGRVAAEAERDRPLPPKAQVFHDEVVLKGSKAVVGGTVRNIADETLEDLSVEIELKTRDGRASEMRSVRVEPASLDRGEEGRFTLQINSGDWGGTRVARLFSPKVAGDIPFKPELGARRPPERAPSPKVIVVPRPKPKGDGFLNTPDTPIRIP